MQGKEARRAGDTEDGIYLGIRLIKEKDSEERGLGEMERSSDKLQRSRQREAVGTWGDERRGKAVAEGDGLSSVPAAEFKAMVIGCRKATGLGWNQVQACPPPPFTMHAGQVPNLRNDLFAHLSVRTMPSSWGCC